MSRGLVPRKQEQEHHGDHFVATEPRAFLFDPHEFGDQTLATLVAGALQVLSQIALHCRNGRHQA